MRKKLLFILLLCVLSTFLYAKNRRQNLSFIYEAVTADIAAVKRDLLCMMLAYPDHITGVEQRGAEVYLVLKSGKKLIYDDKKVKSNEAKIAYPDIQDMLEQPYPLADIDTLMEKGFDPGRRRVYELLNEVYGASQTQIERNLTSVKAGYGSLRFNKNNNAAKALERVMQELGPLAEKRSDIRACMYPFGGTYNYRVIAGTNRLSPHSYAIAIDLARDNRDYWQWASREEGQKRLDSYPREIVEVFERNNFIWGGKWGHFDILHFEYRPELVLKARYFGDGGNSETWYKGAPEEDEFTRECIRKIDEAIKQDIRDEAPLRGF